MNADIRKLKRDYRAMRAPAYLATRIRAEAPGHESRRRTWRPALAMIVVVVAGLLVTPLALRQEPETAPPAPTSMSTLAQVSRHKPAMAMPGLSRISGVSIPALPRKPDMAARAESRGEPQSLNRTRNQPMEENDHAYS